MEIITVIIGLGLLIFFSHFFNEIFNLTRIPNVLLLLLIGIIAGPASGLISQDFFGKFGNVFTTLTLIIILFESGVNLKFLALKKSIGSATIITIVNFIITVAIATFVFNFFARLDWVSSVFLGATIGGTSSAVVIPMIKQLKLGERGETILLLESALSDVLCLVVGLAVFEGMKAGAINIVNILDNMWRAFLFAALIGLAAGFVWSLLLKAFRSIKNSMFTSLAMVFIVYGVVELLGYNGGIATLSFGIILGNMEGIAEARLFRKILKKFASALSIEERNFFGELVFIAQTYFFVYIGISIKFTHLSIYLIGFLVVFLAILSRPVSIKLLSKKDTAPRDVAIMSILTPKGLVAAVLASLPLMFGLPDGEKIQSLGYSIVFLSIVICSLLVTVIHKDPFFFKKIFASNKRKKEEAGEEQLPGNNTGEMTNNTDDITLTGDSKE